LLKAAASPVAPEPPTGRLATLNAEPANAAQRRGRLGCTM